MAKRQKSFFERLSELNSKHEQKPEQPKAKKRKKAMIAVLTILGAVVVTSITIPLAVSVNKVTYTDALPSETVLFKYSDNNGKTQDLTLGETLNLIKGAQDKTDEKIEQLYKHVVQFWYEKEVKASKEYQRIWNSSRYAGEAERNDIALKEYSEINKDNKNRLEDLKNQLIRIYGFENWKKQYDSELNKEEYGKSSTEEEALEYLNFKQIETEALRHYQINLEKNLSLREINRVATKDIYQIDDKGNVVANNGTPVVLIKKGEKIFNYYIEQNANNLQNANYAISSTDNTKAVAITTKSFINNLKSVSQFVNKYYQSSKLILPTVYKLPGKINANLSLPWSFEEKDKSVLINLAKFTLFNNNDNSFEIKSNLDILKSFKHSKDYYIPSAGETLENLNKKRAEDESLIDVLTLNTADSSVQGITTLASQIQSNTAMGLALTDKNLPKLKLDDLFDFAFSTEVKEQIKTQLDEIKKLTNKNDAINKLDALNRYIDSVFASLSTSEFEQMIQTQFNKHINIKVNNQELASYAYNLSDVNGAILVVSSEGTYLLKTQEINSIDELYTYLQNDLKSIANGNSSFFKLDSALNVVYSKNDIIADTLNNDEFKEYLFKQTNKFSDDNTKYTQADLDALQVDNQSVIQANKAKSGTDLISNLSKWLEGQLSGTSYNFKVENGIAKRVLSWSPLQLANESALDELTKLVETITKGGK
ncbi:HinT-interacting membrane complex protein P80 [Mycoplasmopsis columboralis]|uniref:Membrane protein P80 n=1 Tax=Mycoplasmopsis columboralis TaxID=171282 RepID=A0A449B6Z6_9BACT|nr:hypothetical protein [Mycoplasmopsis columboralis]VEU76342.1 Uncharacterised protein [Mycoplasmopsis columboralis]